MLSSEAYRNLASTILKSSRFHFSICDIRIFSSDLFEKKRKADLINENLFSIETNFDYSTEILWKLIWRRKDHWKSHLISFSLEKWAWRRKWFYWRLNRYSSSTGDWWERTISYDRCSRSELISNSVCHKWLSKTSFIDKNSLAFDISSRTSSKIFNRSIISRSFSSKRRTSRWKSSTNRS